VDVSRDTDFQVPQKVSRRANGRISYPLTMNQIMLAHEVAEKRNRHPRDKDKYKPTGQEGLMTHVQGALAEIAACELFGGSYDPVFGGRDDGWDFTLDGRTVQVKSTPHFHPGVRLFSMPQEIRTADLQVLCSVDLDRDYAEIIGWCCSQRLWNSPLRKNKTRKGKTVECRWLWEKELIRPPGPIEPGSEGPERSPKTQQGVI
jgi:hypothetical protein